MSTKTYLCIQRSQPGQPAASAAPSPEQMEQMYAKFNAWRETFDTNIVDLGGKLGAGAVVSAEGTTDGPFIEAKEVVGGYMIISAESLERAAEIARQSPGTWMAGSSVEVREITTS